MPDRLRLGLIFGGRSVEHEVSVVTAEHVLAAADRDRFELVPIGVTKAGAWLSPEETQRQLAQPAPPFQKRLELSARAEPVEARAPRPSTLRLGSRQASSGRADLRPAIDALAGLDVVFPLVHGTYGEDGTLQGLLELAGLPYVGCGVAASALGMDKALMKAVFRDAGLPVAEHVVLRAPDGDRALLAAARDVERRFGYPAFVKPANGGSSVGISKVSSREELAGAIVEAARCDRKLVIEKAVAGREVECAVLGNADAEASPVGEIRHRREFYDYEAKYLDARTEVIVPADLPAGTVERVQDLALRAFCAIDGAGMSRVDFFYCPDGSLVVDEINTIPGFTPGSMFPRLWQARGVNYAQLITRLVDLALARHKERPVV